MDDRGNAPRGVTAAVRAMAAAVRGLRLTIRLKVLILLTLLASAVSAIVATTLISFFNEDKVTYIQDLNTDIAGNTAGSLDLLLHTYGQRVDRVRETFNTAEDPGAALKYLLETSSDFVFLAVYDTRRESVLSLCREHIVADAGVDLDAFLKPRRRLEDSPGYLQSQGISVRNSSASPALLTFSIVVPFVAEAYGETFAIRADFLAAPLLRAVHRTDQGFSTYVVDKRGVVFLHPDPEIMASGRSLADRGVVRDCLKNLGVAAAGTGEYVEAEGEVFLASYAAVREAGLGVLVERPKRDAFLAAARLTDRSTRAAIYVILLAGAFSVFLARALTRSLLDLSRAAARLERGDFSTRVDVRSRDELGDLAHSLNLAAKGLEERETQLKLAYEQLLQSEKLAGFGKFSAGIAHEIKNPLTGIIGFAQLLQRKLKDDDPSRRPLSLIEKEAKRCKTILDNLLKFTRKEGFQFGPVRLHAHIREMLDLISPQLGLNSVEAVLDLAASEDLIRGDANQLQQVFMNLSLNAVDAMEGVSERKLRVSTRAGEPGYVEIVFEDTGSGIPEHVLRKIFDPFFTTKEPGKGTGLGLSVSYGIVTHHGGRIRAQNRPQGGAEFVITLPIASAEVRRAERREGDEQKPSEAGALQPVAG